MADVPERTDLPELLESLNLAVPGQQIILVGAHEYKDISKRPDSTVTSLGVLSRANDISARVRADLCVVNEQIERMSRDESAFLLAKLRDVHCRRVLLVLTNDTWSREDLLSLGYLPVDHPGHDRRYFLFDPDLFSEPREWNNSTHWANPGNFRKYRW